MRGATYPPEDRLGRQELHQISWVTPLRSIPGLYDQLQKVPGEYWRGKRRTAVVKCPCGKAPEPPVGRSVECDCERIYIYTGQAVLVGNSPVVD